MRHALSKAAPYAAAQLFDLVADVERYPDFVPWVTSLAASDRRELADGVIEMRADAQVGFSIVRERFATRVRLDREHLAIDVDLIAGPFRRLKNRWRFTPKRGGSEFLFDIDFEFRTRLLDRLFAANFPRAANRLVKCFEKRAHALYGPR